LSVLLGIRVLARVEPERKLLEGLLQTIFGLLDGNPTNSRRNKRLRSEIP
jgi:TetR/AcrR family transcriptional repressor of nem operon